MSFYSDASIIVTANQEDVVSSIVSLKPTDGSGDLTFSRASTATYIGEDSSVKTALSNEARIDFLGGGCPAILREPSRTNLLTYSEYDAANPTDWIVVFATGTFNYTLDSFKGRPALIHEQSASGRSPIQQAVTFASSTTYTFRMMVDTANSSGVSASTVVCGVFNLSDVTGDTSATYGEVDADGFVEFTFTTGTDTTGDIRIGLGTSGNVTGTLKHGMPDLQTGIYGTSFIPTLATTVTRAAESISKTGISSLLGSAAGTINFNASVFDTTTDKDICISDGTTSNRALIRFTSSGTISFIFDVGGVNQATITGGSYTANTLVNIGIGWELNNFALYVNGTQVGTDVSGSVPAANTFTDLNFDDGSGSNPFYGRFVLLLNTASRLSNARISQLTT